VYIPSALPTPPHHTRDIFSSSSYSMVLVVPKPHIPNVNYLTISLLLSSQDGRIEVEKNVKRNNKLNDKKKWSGKRHLWLKILTEL
jgi:hypothetical protein